MASPEKLNTSSDEEEIEGGDEIDVDEHLGSGSRESVFQSMLHHREDTSTVHEHALPDLSSIKHLEHSSCKEEGTIHPHAVNDSNVRSGGRNPIDKGQQQLGSETASLLSQKEPYTTEQNSTIKAAPNPEPEPKPEQTTAEEILYSKMARDEDMEADPPDPEGANQTHWKQDGIKNTISNSPAALIW